jgi:hypothetical protein
MEPGICMGDGSSTEDAKSAGMSPFRLRVGVFLILLWIVPFWALAPLIADSLSGLSNPPSVAAVTTTIVVVQTILGLVGFWVAGTQVKSIIKSSAKLRAIGAIWSMLLHGISEVRATSAMTRMKRDHHARAPSYFAVADRRPHPNAVHLRARVRPVPESTAFGSTSTRLAAVLATGSACLAAAFCGSRMAGAAGVDLPAGDL